MKENETKNILTKEISKKTLLKIIIAFIVLLVVAWNGYILWCNRTPLSTGENNFYMETYEGKEYFIIEDDYTGEYNIQYSHFEEKPSSFETKKVMNYYEYAKYCREWKLDKKYTNRNWNYIIYSVLFPDTPSVKVRLAGIEVDSSDATVYIWDETSGYTSDNTGYTLIIPTEKNVKNVTFKNIYELEEYHDVIGQGAFDKTYTIEENRNIAQNAYINTSDDEIDSIFNKMLDEVARQHTIEINSEENTLVKMDPTTSTAI